jgi:hypothetical protein
MLIFIQINRIDAATCWISSAPLVLEEAIKSMLPIAHPFEKKIGSGLLGMPTNLL